MELQGKTALVTGAAGFIGSWLVERLVAERVRVRGLVLSGQRAHRLRALGVEVIEGDVRDAPRMREVAAGCDLTFHLAAWLGDPPDPELAWSTNVTGTENVLAAAADCERFIYVSSIMVYGAVANGVVTEDHPYGVWHPRLEAYGATKIEAERRVFQAFRTRELPVTVIRPANVYGPRAGSWVSRALQRMKVGRPILIGGGYGLANPIYVENLVDGILLATRCEQAIGEAFNLSDGSAMTYREFYTRYGRLFGLRPRSLPTPLAYLLALLREVRGTLTGQVPSLTRRMVRLVTGRPLYSIEKAQRLLGYTPQVDFATALQRIEAWYAPRHSVC